MQEKTKRKQLLENVDMIVVNILLLNFCDALSMYICAVNDDYTCCAKIVKMHKSLLRVFFFFFYLK